ncbi:MAG: O-acetylhomoserine aminocarboxypropyltransferase/cysteine synthase family protein [Pseudomonadota bacterium]
MNMDKQQGFDTKSVHAGAGPDPATGARQVPIYQTTSFVFKDAAHAARLFNLEEVGYIYSRLTNPTVGALQKRMAELEGGVGAVAFASGHAAQLGVMFALMEPGCNLVASNKLYGGTVQQFNNMIAKFGWSARLVDFDDLGAVEAAIDSNTRMIFFEALANPGGVVIDVEAISALAHKHGLPVISDNTLASPALFSPFDWGCDLSCHSTTKFITGNGSTVGGIVVDSGRFDWSKSGHYPSLAAANPAYHGLNFHAALGEMAFTFYAIAVVLRDLGACQSPHNAFQTLLGLETLSMRMERHSMNALAVAEFLERHPKVNSVSYAGLKSSPYYARACKYLPRGAGAVLTFALQGDKQAGLKFSESLELFSMLANIGDARSLVIHPASTTHSQLSDAEKALAGAGDDVIRLSIGLENIDDLIRDLESGLAKI